MSFVNNSSGFQPLTLLISRSRSIDSYWPLRGILLAKHGPQRTLGKKPTFYHVTHQQHKEFIQNLFLFYSYAHTSTYIFISSEPISFNFVFFRWKIIVLSPLLTRWPTQNYKYAFYFQILFIESQIKSKKTFTLQLFPF